MLSTTNLLPLKSSSRSVFTASNGFFRRSRTSVAVSDKPFLILIGNTPLCAMVVVGAKRNGWANLPQVAPDVEYRQCMIGGQPYFFAAANCSSGVDSTLFLMMALPSRRNEMPKPSGLDSWAVSKTLIGMGLFSGFAIKRHISFLRGYQSLFSTWSRSQRTSDEYGWFNREVLDVTSQQRSGLHVVGFVVPDVRHHLAS